VQEYGAAAAGDAGEAVVVDLDNKIIEVVVAPEPVAAVIAAPPYRLVVMAARGVFAPGIVRSDGANR
jgi:hypothetical protein